MVHWASVGRGTRIVVLGSAIPALAVLTSCQQRVVPPSRHWAGERVILKRGVALQAGGSGKIENARLRGTGAPAGSTTWSESVVHGSSSGMNACCNGLGDGRIRRRV